MLIVFVPKSLAAFMYGHGLLSSGEFLTSTNVAALLLCHNMHRAERGHKCPKSTRSSEDAGDITLLVTAKKERNTSTFFTAHE